MSQNRRAYAAAGLFFILATAALSAVAVFGTRSQVKGWETVFEKDALAQGGYTRLRWLDLDGAERAKLDGLRVEAVGYAKASPERGNRAFWVVADRMVAGPDAEAPAGGALRIDLPGGVHVPPAGAMVRAKGLLRVSDAGTAAFEPHGVWFKAAEPAASCDHQGCRHHH